MSVRKNRSPRQMLERHEIARRFAAARSRRVIVVSAPGGFGKSAAIDAYVRDDPAGVVRFDARRTDASLARFLRSFDTALHRALPQMEPGSEIAFELATQPALAADAFAERLACATATRAVTIVLDELHHGETDCAIAAFVAYLIERCGANVRFILAVRSTDGLPLAHWLAAGICAPPIDGDALALTNAEALDLGARFAPMLTAATILRLRDRTAGAAAVFTFVLRTLACDPRDAHALLATGGDAFARCADYVFARFTPFERMRLIESVVLPGL